MNNFFLQQAWRRLSGYREIELNKKDVNLEQEFKKIERVVDDFVTKMKNRIKMGHFRYGGVAQKNYDYFGYAKAKMDIYEQTSNAEFLVDAANLMMLEFIHGDNHFEADSSEEGKAYDIPNQP